MSEKIAVHSSSGADVTQRCVPGNGRPRQLRKSRLAATGSLRPVVCLECRFGFALAGISSWEELEMIHRGIGFRFALTIIGARRKAGTENGQRQQACYRN